MAERKSIEGANNENNDINGSWQHIGVII